MNNNPKGTKNPKKPLIFYYAVMLLVLMMLNWLLFPSLLQRQVTEVGYDEFISMVDKGQVETIAYDKQNQEITFEAKNDKGKDALYKTGIFPDDELAGRLLDSGVKFTAEIPTQTSPLLSMLISYVVPIVLIIAVGQWLQKKMMKNMGGNMMSFGKSNAKIYAETETGKTLLAKAVAGEAHVPFFSISGSEFVEMFVGMGAAKVRDLFKQASEKAPCIVFIDEIDTIGKKRDGAGMGGNDEREQTLNQLLTEMDGFDGTKGVVILAATNRPESLDPALLRPGRFDRRIPVQLPDLQGRIAILKVHAKDVHMSGNIDFNSIARATSGASGADLANIINEAALRAVRLGRNSVIQADLDESVETVIAGAQRKNAVLSAKEKEIVAYHEIGHALVAAKQTDSAPVTKITIVPRTSGALGYTMQVDEGEHNLMSKDELLNKVATLTGGRAAEELIFGSITTGASNDIEQATKLTRSMITRYGMSRKFDMVALETVTNQYLSGDTALACSAETAAKIDEEVIATVKTAHEKAIGILQNNMDALHRLAHFLLEKETITGEEFMDLLHKSE